MSDRPRIRDAVFAAVIATFRVREAASIGETTSADEVAGWNSLSHTMLLMTIEEELGFELPLERVYNAANLGELIDIIGSEAPSSREDGRREGHVV